MRLKIPQKVGENLPHLSFVHIGAMLSLNIIFFFLELANNYKEDGNFNFKCRKYRFAILAYTEGLKQKCKDNELNAQLYNNRSACNFFLKNYR